MTKLQTILASLIAVIPAAVVAVMLVMALLSYSENLTAMSYVIMSITLLAVLATALIPAWIVIAARRKPAPATVAVADTSSEEIEAADEAEGVEDDEDVLSSSASFDAHNVLSEPSDAELGNSDQDLLGGSSEFDLGGDSADDFEMVDFEEEEEEPKPKKKKR